MTNWKTYTIISKSGGSGSRDFYLDNYVGFKYDNCLKDISLANCYPFSDYEVGDQIEIDLDHVRRYACNHVFDDTNAILNENFFRLILM